MKSIQLLDQNGFHKECDVLLRSLDEMIIDMAYLELDPKNSYERHYLYTYWEKYNLIKEKCDDDNIDITTINQYNEIKQKHDEYERRRYQGKLSRWSGKSFFDEAQELDDKTTNNNIMPFTMLFKRIYRLNCLFSHNSGIILDQIYKFLDVDIEPDYLYFHNLNYVVILTAFLILVIFPQLFVEEAPFLKEFDSFIGAFKMLQDLSKD